MGKTMLDSLVDHCRTDSGYTGLKDVATKEKDDYWESFFLAETFSTPSSSTPRPIPSGGSPLRRAGKALCQAKHRIPRLKKLCSAFSIKSVNVRLD